MILNDIEKTTTLCHTRLERVSALIILKQIISFIMFLICLNDCFAIVVAQHNEISIKHKSQVFIPGFYLLNKLCLLFYNFKIEFFYICGLSTFFS